MADRVMRGDSLAASRPAPIGIQRKCKDCEEENERIHRKAAPASTPAVSHDAGSAVHAARGGGQALPRTARDFFEPRFGHDFSRVKVHADGGAARAARAIHARAYTLGHDIVFGASEYDPHSHAGRWLLAHELAHVVQQSRGAYTGVQAKLVVEDPGVDLPGTPVQKNWQEIQHYIRLLSSSFDVSSSGVVAPTGADTCAKPVRTTDRCLCDLHNSKHDWKIKIDDVDWPHTEEANHRVTVHSRRSPIEFGAWGGGAQAGTRIAQDNERVLGHELCGHAWLMERSVHPTGPPPVFVGRNLMGRPSHDPTIAIENIVAGEMTTGAPTRGSFADPHHGESFARVTVSGFATNATDPATLSSDMQARLVRAKDAMLTNTLMRADVVGHSDRVGSTRAKNAVARGRARRTRDHLIRLGVSRSQFMEVIGRGDAECTSGPANNPACHKAEIFMFMFQGSSLRNP